jgi:hypothetical protein
VTLFTKSGLLNAVWHGQWTYPTSPSVFVTSITTCSNAWELVLNQYGMQEGINKALDQTFQHAWKLIPSPNNQILKFAQTIQPIVKSISVSDALKLEKLHMLKVVRSCMFEMQSPQLHREEQQPIAHWRKHHVAVIDWHKIITQ